MSIDVGTTEPPYGNASVCSGIDVHGDVDIAAGMCYLPFLVWGVVLGIQICRTRALFNDGIMLIMITVTCLCGSLCLRAMWFTVHCVMVEAEDGWVPSVLGSFGVLFFFTSFSVYVYSWARSVQKRRQKCARRVTIWVNVALYLFAIVLNIYFGTTSGGDYLVQGFGADMIHLTVAVCDLLLCVAFAVYGGSALRLMNQSRAQTRTVKRASIGWRM